MTGAEQPTALLSSFDGQQINGPWTLFVADVSGGDLNTLVSWGIQVDVATAPESGWPPMSTAALLLVSTSGTPDLSELGRTSPAQKLDASLIGILKFDGFGPQANCSRAGAGGCRRTPTRQVRELATRTRVHESCLAPWLDGQPQVVGVSEVARHTAELKEAQHTLPEGGRRRLLEPFFTNGGPHNGRFDFLGFEFYWEPDRQGKPRVKRRTATKKLRAGMQKMREWIKTHRHQKLSRTVSSSPASIRDADGLARWPQPKCVKVAAGGGNPSPDFPRLPVLRNEPAHLPVRRAHSRLEAQVAAQLDWRPNRKTDVLCQKEQQAGDDDRRSWVCGNGSERSGQRRPTDIGRDNQGHGEKLDQSDGPELGGGGIAGAQAKAHSYPAEGQDLDHKIHCDQERRQEVGGRRGATGGGI